MADIAHKAPQAGDRAASPGLSDQSFRLLVDSVRDYAIFMLDPHGYVVTWNLGAQRIKGYTEGEIVGQHFSRFYGGADARARTQQELEIAEREGRFEEEGWRVRKDGTTFWASVVITPLRDLSGRLTGFAKVTRDLTERRRLEEERVRTAQAEEAVRVRDEFLSIASHELRTPLTALQLQLGSLVSHSEAGSPLGRKLERANRSVHRLAALIDTLLDVSRIAAGRLELRIEPCDLSALVASVGDYYGEALRHAGCELRLVMQPVSGAWDKARIEQVVTNLLANAIKYGAGAPIEVTLSDEDGSAVLVVRDAGPGIEPEKLEAIFQRFERAVSVKHYGGLGLGLYVARQIVAAHGGDIRAFNNEAGPGACFRVVLPLQAPTGSGEEAREATERASASEPVGEAGDHDE